jgi:hypothetical protein
MRLGQKRRPASRPAPRRRHAHRREVAALATPRGMPVLPIPSAPPAAGGDMPRVYSPSIEAQGVVHGDSPAPQFNCVQGEVYTSVSLGSWTDTSVATGLDHE